MHRFPTSSLGGQSRRNLLTAARSLIVPNTQATRVSSGPPAAIAPRSVLPPLRAINTSASQGLHATPAAAYPPKARKTTDRSKSRAFKKPDKKSAEKKTVEYDFMKSDSGGPTADTSVNPLYYTDPTLPVLPPLSTADVVPENIGQVYALPTDFVGKFKASQFPGMLFDCFTKSHSDGLMVRKPLLQLARLLVDPKARADQGPLTLLAGSRGTGKSATLLQTVALAYLQKWFVLYVPNATTWVDSSQPYSVDPNDPAQYVQPEVTAQWLGFLAKINGPALEKATLPTVVTLGEQTLAAGSPVADLLHAGADQPAVAHQALEALLTLVRRGPTPADGGLGVPTLVAVDQVNALYISTEYYSTDHQRLAPGQLRLIQSVRALWDDKKTALNPTAGLVVTAADMSRSEFLVPGLSRYTGRVPAGKLTDPVPTAITSIEIPPYSKSETMALFKFYQKSDLVYHPIDQVLATKRWILTNGNGSKLFQYCLRHTNADLL
ncbi:hypothetical protein IWQ60_011362 [Tieghemiomyces parasiticus]|uniref:Small ribosomal subunit protein mS29 n=1 Tax=Tieghemiomyces parasiticus TaxID=78921 RepID=A0A9W7ZQN6_9FUNG|nr:hypothetical protein IWQ60_011362 [Tieghemiomyces parasiticus]